jgi:hypothetical protein
MATKKPKIAMVIYQGSNEVLICIKKHEKKMLATYFSEGDRDREDYARDEITENGVFELTSSIRARCNIKWAEEAPTEWERNYRAKKAEVYYKAAQVYLDAITELEKNET